MADMVRVGEPVREADAPQWLGAVTARLPQQDVSLLAHADTWAQSLYGETRHPGGEAWLAHARGVAGIMDGLRVDAEALVAALLIGAPIATVSQREALAAEFGKGVVALLEGVASMAQIQALRGHVEAGARHADRAGQIEALRKMLLAMAQDVRVVLIKLADQTQWLREIVRQEDVQAKQLAAADTLELLAPLANRLGVWQIKWELEDLAFRCLEPETYRNLARQLDEKRSDREAYIARVMNLLRAELEEAGIKAELAGRPKHIYSIWRKMQKKGVGLDHLFDVRAVRLLVADVRDCYAALGVVHNLWTPIPQEFDDYIAKPKANDYRSLHTAVVGPDDKVLEVQIRTHDMHQHAELGIAAHWRYKESPKDDKALDQRIAWLRRVLDWRDELAEAGELAEYFKAELVEDNIYVLTPQGRVIDLPRGATPVDFAYHVHSGLGHRCRGARVNGQIVPLNHVLANGQRVEIITAREGGPSRDWLNPALGYLKSNRARAKVRQWFNNQQVEAAVTTGRAALEKELQRAGRTGQNLEDLAGRLKFAKVEELFAAFGRGEVSSRQVQAALAGSAPVPAPAPAANELPAALRRPENAGGILLVGVDKLLTVLARCCKPAPPDPIVGFVTRGRGVTVHRRNCSNLGRLPAERLIAADWGQTGESRFPVDVEVLAGSHPELAREILDIFTREKVRVLSSRSHVQDLSARLGYTLEVQGLGQLSRLLAQVGDLPGVESVRRR